MVEVRRTRGFSLMETLGALALLALLLLGVTAVLQVIRQSTRATMALAERFDRMQATHRYVRRALSGALAYPFMLDEQRRAVVFEGDARAMTFVANGPGYLATSGLQRQRVSLEGSEGDLRLTVSFAPLPTRDGARVVPDAPEVLVDHVLSGRFVYSGMDDAKHPVTRVASWPYPDRLPTMVGIELTLRPRLTWPTLAVPLRMDPAATNAREALARLRGDSGMPHFTPMDSP